MAMWEEERRERFEIDRKDLADFNKSIRGIHKTELDELMINYITDNRLEFKETEAIRLFVRYLKEQ